MFGFKILDRLGDRQGEGIEVFQGPGVERQLELSWDQGGTGSGVAYAPGANPAGLNDPGHFMAIKIDFGADAAGTIASLWVNPVIANGAGGLGAAGATASNIGDFDNFFFSSGQNNTGGTGGEGGRTRIDETRFGGSFADIHQTNLIPEPTSMALLLMAGLGGLLRTRH